jgi:hypothetical protein
VSQRRVSGSRTCGALPSLEEMVAAAACLVRALKTAAAVTWVRLLPLRVDSMQGAGGGEAESRRHMHPCTICCSSAIFCGREVKASKARPRRRQA